MPDIKKVIEALHCRAYDDDLPCSICAYYRPDEKPVAKCDYQGLMDDAIELLKEQNGTINELQNAYDYLQKQFFEVQDKLLKQEAVEPFHKCIGKDFSLIEDSHFDYCPYCGKPITWAKQEGR
jgi:hypothetical protein